jgi:hypothetical protein
MGSLAIPHPNLHTYEVRPRKDYRGVDLIKGDFKEW